MAVRDVIRRVPWTRQPSVPVSIDWSNPITQGLMFAVIPGNRRNIVDGVALSGTFYTAPVLGVRKVGVVLTSGSYQYPEPTTSVSPEAKFDLTLGTAMVFGAQDSTQNADLSFSRSNGSSAAGWGIGLHGGGFNGAQSVFGSYSYTPPSSGSSTLVPRLAIVVADGANASTYLDGAKVDGPTAYTAPTYQYATGGRSVVFGNNPNTNPSNVRASVAAFWNRALCPAEIASLAVNPYQIFAPTPRKMWAAAAAAPSTLAGSSAVVASSAGALSTSTALAGTPTVLASSTGALTTAVTLAGSSAAQASSTGAITSSTALAASSGMQVSTTADLVATPPGLASSVFVQMATTGRLSTPTTLSGTSLNQAISTANLAATVPPPPPPVQLSTTRVLRVAELMRGVT